MLGVAGAAQTALIGLMGAVALGAGETWSAAWLGSAFLLFLAGCFTDRRRLLWPLGTMAMLAAFLVPLARGGETLGLAAVLTTPAVLLAGGAWLVGASARRERTLAKGGDKSA